jgi:uncharacterized membrane protein YphA (DoxX/SURF4 family)
MSRPASISRIGRGQDLLTLLARLVVGGVYVFMGLRKALDPVVFLKLTRQYELVDTPFWLNLIAASLPWFEVFCGLLLLAGVAVRGAALVSFATLVPFTVLVWKRALLLQAASPLPFCSVRFDCGCGAGEVYICHKLAENGALILLSLWLLFAPRLRACLWPELLKR